MGHWATLFAASFAWIEDLSQTIPNLSYDENRTGKKGSLHPGHCGQRSEFAIMQESADCRFPIASTASR